MSPHSVPVAGPHSQTSLRKFAITSNAFLPEHSPCQMLSDSYYEPWELIAQHLAPLIDEGRLHDAVQQMPVLSVDRLRDEAEWRRAYVLLGFMTHGYVWGGDKPEEILPPQIAVPFLRVSARFELPPVLTYAAANLWNFSCDADASGTHDFTNLETLKTLVSFTGTPSEDWFLLISVAMEAKAAGVIPTMLHAFDAIKSRDLPVVTHALEELTRCIKGVGAMLERMYERCEPTVFYHQIRPFLAGSKNMEAAGLPRGVFYDEGNGKGEWMQLRGGSNGQSSLIQFFDVVLGVEHNTHGSAGQKSFHNEVREYMPGPHRRFLTHVAQLGSIRELAMSSLSRTPTAEETKLRDTYQAATAALSQFRDKHIQIVTRYIILPSRQPWKKPEDKRAARRKNLASSSTAQKDQGELTGTGGTTLVPFLRQARDDTLEAGKLARS